MAHPDTPHSEVLQSVQVLRALAALMVVVCHSMDNIASLISIGENGSILNFGVDLFFVISGFIMVRSTSGRRMDSKQFMLARLIRIVPLYWLALAATIALLALTDGRVPALTEVVRAAFFIPYEDPASGAYLPFLPVGWTLSYEMVFYLVFAATIALGGIRQLMVISLLFLLLVGARLVFHPEGAIAFRLTSPLFFEFTMGMLVALVWPRLITLRPLAGIILLAGGTAALFAMHPLHAQFEFPRFIAYGVPAALVVAGSLVLEPWFQARLFGPLRSLGDASYSLYLSHPLPMLVLPALLPATWSFWADVAVLTAVSITLGVACYRLIEKRLNQAFRHRIGRRGSLAIA